MPSAIATAIDEVLDCFENPPPNESNTCEWVILPLLWAAGYARREIHSRVLDHSKQYPDYTLLPNSPEHRWYVEAKAWSVDLDHSHATQALDYANHNGVRWVLLTNGRNWRLYNNAVQGLVGHKLVIELGLKEKRFHEFLTAIGKESVLSGGLELLAEAERQQREHRAEAARREKQQAERRERLAILLPLQLTDENSDLLDWMCEVLRSEEGLQDLTSAEVAEYFRSMPGIAGAGGLEKRREPAEQRTFEAAPLPAEDETGEVLVVAANFAHQEYMLHSAYICQPRRTFRQTSHLAFYVQGKIDRHVPRILERVESVVLTEEAIRARTDLPEKTRNRLLTLLDSLRTNGQIHNRAGSEAKVLFLSRPDSPETIHLLRDVENDLVTSTGKPWPFTAGQRYASLARLKQNPATTTHLLSKIQ